LELQAPNASAQHSAPIINFIFNATSRRSSRPGNRSPQHLCTRARQQRRKKAG
jgi:hypothetical protein